MSASGCDCSGLACVPGAISAEDRPAHFELIRKLFGSQVREKADLPNGYAYLFVPDAFEAVTRFITNERKCCPFLAFELEVAPLGGPLWLRMTGPTGTKEVLEAELAAA